MVGRSAGFTLVELAVTLVILAIVMAAAAPFTVSWAQGARVMEAKTKLQQGYDLAKALAQRNAIGVNAPAVAAGLKLDMTALALFVCTGDPATSPTCVANGSNVVWHTTLPANTRITSGAGSGNQTLGLDNTGTPLSGIHFTVTNGGQSESFDLLQFEALPAGRRNP